MLDYLLSLFAGLNLDWGVLILAAIVFILVYIAGVSGLAESGNAKRVAGALAGLALGAVNAQVLAAGDNAIIAMLAPALVSWLLAALAHAGIEAGIEKIKAS